MNWNTITLLNSKFKITCTDQVNIDQHWSIAMDNWWNQKKTWLLQRESGDCNVRAGGKSTTTPLYTYYTFTIGLDWNSVRRAKKRRRKDQLVGSRFRKPSMAAPVLPRRAVCALVLHEDLSPADLFRSIWSSDPKYLGNIEYSLVGDSGIVLHRVFQNVISDF